MNARLIPALAVAGLLLAGCHPSGPSTTTTPPPSPSDEAAAANALFLNQKTFDPWVLTSSDPYNSIPFYSGDGYVGETISPSGQGLSRFVAGRYKNGQIEDTNLQANKLSPAESKPSSIQQSLNFRTGSFTTNSTDFKTNSTSASEEQKSILHISYSEHKEWSAGEGITDWPRLWQTSDIVIQGDPEAQQVTHANLFYLLSSTFPRSDHSIPPFGLSSNLYGGHIFWDAEIFMLPALLPQHPEYAKSIIDYRFKRLGQAKKNAKMHGFQGAEYPWESADTGEEMVGGEFAKERHITADVGWAAWQYYQWTGDKDYLKNEGWPIIQACADYWLSRITKGTGTDYTYHIKGVLGPDETAGVVDDDAWTNGVVTELFRAATEAQKTLDAWPNNAVGWSEAAYHMYLPYDKKRGIVAENNTPLPDRFAAKQADALLVYYPLQNPGFAPDVEDPTLDFYLAHTIKNGPAMTASMEAVIAARRLRPQQSLDLFRDSYRPFMRGPWDAFAEKRTSNRVYFCTGMGGCLQSVLYGFAG